MSKKHKKAIGWDKVAHWYQGWVGESGSEHHQRLAIPTVLELLQLKEGEHILDIGAGTGLFAPYITRIGGKYTGIEISPTLLKAAQRTHGKHGDFILADARQLDQHKDLTFAHFDAAVFLLSIQDMNPLEAVIRSATWALRPHGRIIILMTHPCFNIPRQSGWGYDETRHLQYRRVDRYLTPLSIPMKPYLGKNKGITLSFHRPLSDYINILADHGLLVNCLQEITTYKQGNTSAQISANREIPIFMAIRAIKMT